ncbi:MAG: DUF4097 family beta strand repeat protein [Nanoarchaeota archaeon]|nr:DUF4097 family beta strand repeat protein [Nanoarchaeota archaeon]
MNKLGKTIIIWAVIFVVSTAIGGALFLTSTEFIDYTTGNYDSVQVNDSLVLPFGDLEINSLSTDIEIIETDSNMVKVELVGRYTEGSYANSPRLEILEGEKNTVVNIVYPKYKLVLGFAQNRLKLNVYVPKGFTNELYLSTASGDVDGANFEAGSLKIKTLSGNAKIMNLNSDYLEVSSASGDVDLENAITDRINTISGNVKINSFIERNLNVKTVSGDVKINDLGNKKFRVYFESVSGDSNDLSVFGGERIIDVKTTSGNLYVA